MPAAAVFPPRPACHGGRRIMVGRWVSSRHVEMQMARASTARPIKKTIPVSAKGPVALIVNGVERRLEVAPWTTLLDAVRDHLDPTGTKKGCDHAQCGARRGLRDGARINYYSTAA